MYSHMQLSEIRGVNTHYTCLLQKDERLVWRKKVTHIQGGRRENSPLNGELYLLRVRGQTPRPSGRFYNRGPRPLNLAGYTLQRTESVF